MTPDPFGLSGTKALRGGGARKGKAEAGLQLDAALLASSDADADHSISALRHLFAAFGPPLVFKTDNGSHLSPRPL